MTTPARPSNFTFVAQAWPELIIECRRVEEAAISNPRAAMFQARYVLERVVGHIARLNNLRSGTLFDITNSSEFKRLLSPTMLEKVHVLRMKANKAVHADEHITSEEAVQTTKHLYDFLTYATTHFTGKTITGIQPFDVRILEQHPHQAAQTKQQMLALSRKVEASRDEAEQYKLLLDDAQQQQLDQAAEYEREIKRLREEIKRHQEALTPAPVPLAVDEAQTRREIINPMLEAAGFTPGVNLREEFPVGGLRIDYVLLDSVGVPIAVIEAKKAHRTIDDGRQQAAAYADAIEAEYGRTPLIFYTNGYEVRFWDRDTSLPGGGGYESRPIEAYPTQQQMEALVARRSKRQPLAVHGSDIAGRPYQLQMMQSVAERFGQGHRRSLLVMATGTGKTRVAIATVKLLIESGWVRNVLFLADRKALVTQAHNAFVEHYGQATPVNLTTNPDGQGQVYVSTYQTMMNLVGPGNRFNAFDFDLIVVDEAHRSIYQRYGTLFDYLDALVIGLTATPRSNIGHDTYNFFRCEPDSPTGYYGLEEAIADHNLVPYKVFSGSTSFLRRGISYDELTEAEQIAWEQAEWGIDENGDPLPAPAEVDSTAINRRLLNRDTVRKVLRQVLDEGLRVDGADRIGKTIIFARNQAHANLIAEEFREAVPASAGTRDEVITHSVHNAEALITEFKKPHSGLDVAISVDMLDTGVDVPEVLNLVFFKPVYSPTKFWQMVGRGTRLCPNLFGAGVDKEHFYIFDYCGNISQFPAYGKAGDTTGSRQKSLAERTFRTRAQLLAEAPEEVRGDVAKQLASAVATVPPDSILVPSESRAYLDTYTDPEAWTSADTPTLEDAVEKLAQLPFGNTGEDESSRRFDYLIYQLQLGLYEPAKNWEKLVTKVSNTAEALLAKTNIPHVAAAAETLDAVREPEWWEAVTYFDLEHARRVIRDIVRYLDKGKMNIVITDFEDELGELVHTELAATGGTQRESSVVEEELRRALEGQTTNLALRKLRSAQQLTMQDLEELEQLLVDVHVDGATELAAAGRAELGLFLREIVGMDTDAVHTYFAELMNNTELNSMQRRFLNTVVREIIHNGVVEAQDLQRSPFDEDGSLGEIFGDNIAVVVQLGERLKQLNQTALPDAG